nr:hypothetical protein [Tanacetum cinerariifolium]
MAMTADENSESEFDIEELPFEKITISTNILHQLVEFHNVNLESLDDMITGRKDGSSRNRYSKLSRRGLSSRSIGDRKVYHWCWIDSCLDGNHSIRLNANYCGSSVDGDYDHSSFGAFPSYEAKHRLFTFVLRKGTDFSKESIEKSWGKNRLMKAIRSSSHVLIVPSLSSSNHVFASPGSVLVLPPNWFPLTRVKWLPLIENSFAVSGIVMAEPEVKATTRSAAHMGSSSIRL